MPERARIEKVQPIAPKKTTLARTVKDKWRSKHWFKVRAPGLFQHAELGETMASEPEHVLGRTLETSMQELGGGADIGGSLSARPPSWPSCSCCCRWSVLPPRRFSTCFVL